ncbi:MAG: DUF2178 domain-containing protein [Syntrophaceticus sp.]|nr:DUF2178 domain-containing protein [Syntrophaceticus sp.]
MIKKKKGYYILIVALGMVLMLSGILVEYLVGESRYLGFASGFGAAMIGVGVMNLFLITRKPEVIKQQEINQKDERFVKIREKSAYTTFFITLFGMAAVEMIFLFMDYMIPCFIIIGLMAVHVISLFVFIYHYNKKL